jgi:DNA polymerase-1
MVNEDSITLFDDWLHATAHGDNALGEVVLVRSDDAFSDFRDWLLERQRPLAYDIEASGLDTYSPEWVIKSIQWGDQDKAFVFIWNEPWFQKSIDLVMNETDYRLLAHNATFDALGLDRHNHVDAIELLARTYDTKILSHLADPRSRQEGGVGHGLKNLAAHHVDKSAPDSDSALKEVFQQNKWSVQQGWKNIPATHPTLVQYAGMDVILTARLFPKLRQEIKRQTMDHLVKYEHQILMLVADMERRGMRIDIEYAKRLVEDMTKEEHRNIDIVKSFGVANHNATKDVAAGLQALGVKLLETTNSGALKVDKTILNAICDDEDAGDARVLAQAVMAAKNNAKWRDSYVTASLASMDSDGRVHPKINSLQARTGRMSINNPPLQQLPSGGDAIRRMFLAEDGCRMASIDFSGVELRVLAALSQDPVMLKVFKEGADLHQTTADNTGVTRKVAKTVNFGKVYGAGPKTLARQSGLTVEEAQKVCDLFDSTYQGVTKFSHQLAFPVKKGQRSYVVTHTGRKLPVDEERPYAALNYCIQSTARDVLGRAMLKVRDAGLWDYAVLPIHDEILFSFPEDKAEELCREAGVVMEMILKDVHISTEPDLGGSSWGTLYTEGEHDVIELNDEDRRTYGDEHLIKHLFEAQTFEF